MNMLYTKQDLRSSAYRFIALMLLVELCASSGCRQVLDGMYQEESGLTRSQAIEKARPRLGVEQEAERFKDDYFHYDD